MWRKKLAGLVGNQEKNKRWNCPKSAKTPDSSFAFAADYQGPKHELFYDDPKFGFLRYAVGLNKEQIKASLFIALNFFKDQFGIDFDLDNAIDGTAGYRSESQGLTLSAYMETMKYRLVLHGDMAIKCADVMALSGGWMLETDGTGPIQVFGRHGGSEGILYDGKTVFMTKFVVTAPATRWSTRKWLMPLNPLNIDAERYTTQRATHSPVSYHVYNFDDNEEGILDGVVISEHSGGGNITMMFRGLAMFPGRFDETEKDSGMEESNDGADQPSGSVMEMPVAIELAKLTR